jgi:flagellar biosynthetic protein FliP
VTRHLRLALALIAAVVATMWATTAVASAQEPAVPVPPTIATPSPATPAPGGADGSSGLDGTPGPDTGSDSASATDEDDSSFDVNIDLGEGGDGEEIPSRSVVIILGLTVLAVAPSLLILMTSFTRIIVVLSLVRNALGLQSVPPNQVLAGLALFLSLFVMAPTLSKVNDDALQPYLDGTITQDEALHRAELPLKRFMLANTRSGDLDLMTGLRGQQPPKDAMDTSLVTVVPAFVLSELQSAFIIAIVVFVPFLVLDLVVSAGLMSLGMMMLPPIFVSLPLKLLLFVMVDGWSMITESLVTNYQGVGLA